MNFVEWISRLKDRNTPTGHLAGDIVSDKNFPAKNDRKLILTYLIENSACDDAIFAFKSAWKNYQAYLRNHQ